MRKGKTSTNHQYCGSVSVSTCHVTLALELRPKKECPSRHAGKPQQGLDDERKVVERWYCWWFRNPAITGCQLVITCHHLSFPGGCLGFLPSDHQWYCDTTCNIHMQPRMYITLPASQDCHTTSQPMNSAPFFWYPTGPTYHQTQGLERWEMKRMQHMQHIARLYELSVAAWLEAVVVCFNILYRCVGIHPKPL